MKPQMKYTNESAILIEDFRLTVETISALIESSGISTTPYQDGGLIHFSKLHSDGQKQVLWNAKSYLESLKGNFVSVTNSVGEGGPESLDFRRSLWLALRYLKLRPTSDLFGDLSPGRSIEVYNAEGIQVWRNFRFFEVCGYTIEEMFCYTWQERYERNEFATKQILDVISQFSRETTYTVGCNIYNRLKETFSQQRFIIDVIHEKLSPLYDEASNVAGFVAVSNAQIISTQAARDLDLY